MTNIEKHEIAPFETDPPFVAARSIWPSGVRAPVESGAFSAKSS
jgi:hypothetical protein